MNVVIVTDFTIFRYFKEIHHHLYERLFPSIAEVYSVFMLSNEMRKFCENRKSDKPSVPILFLSLRFSIIS